MTATRLGDGRHASLRTALLASLDAVQSGRRQARSAAETVALCYLDAARANILLAAAAARRGARLRDTPDTIEGAVRLAGRPGGWTWMAPAPDGMAVRGGRGPDGRFAEGAVPDQPTTIVDGPDLFHDLMAAAYDRQARMPSLDVALLAQALATSDWVHDGSAEPWSTDAASALAVAELVGGSVATPLLAPPPGLDADTVTMLAGLGWRPLSPEA